MILDGYGLSDTREANAIELADTPNLDKIFKSCPWAPAGASGFDVGLPDGQMGNSEVGHVNIGAGRIVYQELTRISKEIDDGVFFENAALLKAIENCKKNESSLHLCGLVSDGGVHSHNSHIYALLSLAAKHGLDKVYVHAFLDGRDTPPASGKGYLAELDSKMKELRSGEIATVMGRYYAMDRDNRWERVKKAYDCLVSGIGDTAESYGECMDRSYKAEVYDEFVAPCAITKDGAPTAAIGAGDSVVFFNFRPDRAREITRAFCQPDFTGFERQKGYFPLCYVCFTEYDQTIPNTETAFRSQSLDNIFGQYVSSLGLKQPRLAETEIYAHVTFFFNGGREEPYEGEDRILVPSPKAATYDLIPEMSAPAVTDRLIESILSKKYDVIIINYANCDMVGHTGVMEAAVKAVSAVDACIGRVVETLAGVGGQMLLCADHGNSDKMVDPVTGEPFTAHTTNPVPVAVFNCEKAQGVRQGGRLCDIIPTLLDMMDVAKPAEMDGHTLLIKERE